jgi:hypothetical protein
LQSPEEDKQFKEEQAEDLEIEEDDDSNTDYDKYFIEHSTKAQTSSTVATLIN